MRTPRVAILALFFAASIFLFCRSIAALRRPGPVITTPAAQQKSSQFRSFFSFTAPFTLFPPNAAISLTDDNSTFFPARPAAFGPPLPAKGLSGQLWIGSGFADDNLQDGDGQGEFGCSDVPGWDDSQSSLTRTRTGQVLTTIHGKAAAAAAAAGAKSKSPRKRRGADLAAGKSSLLLAKRVSDHPSPTHDIDDDDDDDDDGQPRRHRPVDDGTDDYLHEALQRSTQSSYDGRSSSSTSSHADIQSIQEAAEITGKVVLLRRGGCGFLEKVKWAQRRGAVAVIVGDNQKGGPLIQMFARGDTSNLTIPAVFTAHTTAHLLSSLMQPGSYIEDIIDENGNAALKVQQFDKSSRAKNRKAKQQQQQQQQQAAAAHANAVPPPPPTGPSSKLLKTGQPPAKKSVGNPAAARGTPGETKSRGWLARWFSWGRSTATVSEKSRPPSSGRLDWVLVDDWSDEKDRIIRTNLERASKDGSKSPAAKTPGSDDSFQIGVQDWRDPDLVGSPPNTAGGGAQSDVSTGGAASRAPGSSSSSSNRADTGMPGASSKQPGGDTRVVKDGPKGGSITPSSGEYTAGSKQAGSSGAGAAAGAGGAGGKAGAGGSSSASGGSGGGLISKIFGDDDGADFSTPTTTDDTRPDPLSTPLVPEPPPPEDGVHEGLWVTITPTSSATPFFDTLLVLVISPLITLSVVYALLILRARIRRRRWRAPKSVVERLPVRTYHTIAPSPAHTPKLPSPTSSNPTTPLLQSSSSSSSSAAAAASGGGSGSSSRPPPPRPRSRTTTGVPDAGDLLRVDAALHGARSSSSRAAEPGSGSHSSSSEWKKYMGRQVECVVCLEEYVDGVSRVMSLPCGHEFHVECITPWLTTRRRTCPICKGDVVRSLARGSPSSPRYDPYQDSSEEDGPSSSSRSRSRPNPGPHLDLGLSDVDDDVEQTILSPSPRRARRPRREGWFSTVANNLGGVPSRNSGPGGYLAGPGGLGGPGGQGGPVGPGGFPGHD